MTFSNIKKITFSSPNLKAQVRFSDQNLSSFIVVIVVFGVVVNLFSRTTEPISTKLGTMHPWVKGIQDCSTEGPYPFTSGR